MMGVYLVAQRTTSIPLRIFIGGHSCDRAHEIRNAADIGPEQMLKMSIEKSILFLEIFEGKRAL
jgi:hypothetical protein